MKWKHVFFARQLSLFVKPFILGVEFLDEQLLSLFSYQLVTSGNFFSDSYPYVWDFVAREVERIPYSLNSLALEKPT